MSIDHLSRHTLVTSVCSPPALDMSRLTLHSVGALFVSLPAWYFYLLGADTGARALNQAETGEVYPESRTPDSIREDEQMKRQ